jgi:peptide/nickel transport system ATP-binding protein
MIEPLLKIQGLTRYFDLSASWLVRTLQGERPKILKAVDHVSFDIPPGKTVAIVGESGCGKSTLARLIAGLDRPTAGQITHDGTNPRVQMIFQDPYASLNPRWLVGDIIAEPLRFRGRSQDSQAIRTRTVDALAQVGLSARDLDRYPHEFSGGQRQRISIARALADEPRFLICDEPTSALDVSVQAQILNLMADLQARLGLTYLFISHNLAVVHHVADYIGVMYLGRMVEWADTAAFFRQPLHPYSRMLLDAIPDLSLSGKPRTAVAGEVPSPLDPPTGCAFHPRCPLANERCRIEQPSMIDMGQCAVACHAAQEGRIA